MRCASTIPELTRVRRATRPRPVTETAPGKGTETAGAMAMAMAEVTGTEVEAVGMETREATETVTAMVAETG
jgi:hypothetical protein